MNIEKPKIFYAREDAPPDTKVIETDEDGKSEKGLWVYYPWHNTLVHIQSEEQYFKLRCDRNRNIITEEEQNNYRNAKVGIAGLSVGSAILSTLALTGGPKVIKIADFDVIEITNLNRVKATLLDIGKKKVEVAAKRVWELDPFAELYIWDSGLTRENLGEFIGGNPKLDIFIDAMDSIELKILARETCRKHNIPVLMATDNGEGIILDVERFDDEPERPLLHGLMENIDLQTPWLELAKKIMGEENIAVSVQKSIPEIGKTISQVPQIGSAASLGGVIISSAVRKIANKQELTSGRYIIDFEKSWKDFKKL